MPRLYYFVRVAKSKSWAQYGSSELLVQLVCSDHANLYGSDRERLRNPQISFGLENLLKQGFCPSLAPLTTLDEPGIKNAYLNAG